jgi:Maltokinase N-terminal cap domain
VALLHEATISPRKDELISPWLRARHWWDGIDERDPVGDFRLDDPAGEVGIQCFLFGSAPGSTLFVPVTYRDAPRPNAETSLIGTMQHSVLGKRWVYDGCADPVVVATVAGVIRNGGREATLRLRRSDGSVIVRESTATVRGNGSANVPQLVSRVVS